METVSWEEAQEFCRKLTDQDRAAPQSEDCPMGSCMPATEAQWEYACRAASNAAFTFGNDERHCQSTRGLIQIPSDKRTPWGIAPPMRLGCTACTATSGNGAGLVRRLPCRSSERPVRSRRGLDPGVPGRLLGQRRAVLPRGVPRLVRAVVPEIQTRLSRGRSATGGAQE